MGSGLQLPGVGEGGCLPGFPNRYKMAPRPWSTRHLTRPQVGSSVPPRSLLSLFLGLMYCFVTVVRVGCGPFLFLLPPNPMEEDQPLFTDGLGSPRIILWGISGGRFPVHQVQEEGMEGWWD